MSNCPISGKPCDKYKAFHITNVKFKEVLNVCEDCLAQAANSENKDINKPKELSLACNNCKMTFEELISKSRLGCDKCYEFFEKPLIVAFEKMHRTPDVQKKELKHVGSVPTQWKKKQAKETDPNKFLLELKQKLDLFIKEEKYENCKKIKDAIYVVERFIKKIDEFENDQEQQQLIRDQISEFIYLYREKELEK